MVAYVVVEASFKNEDARKRYSQKAANSLEQFGGRFIARGEWTVLAGNVGLNGGGIIEFNDRKTALMWYASPAYQSAISDREEAIDCRFSLIS